MGSVNSTDVFFGSWLPTNIDQLKKITFSQISDKTLTDSAFLDARAKGVSGNIFQVDLREAYVFLRDAQPHRPNIFHVFHTSHVGSTFTSRVFESLGDSVLREPAILKIINNSFRDWVFDRPIPFSEDELEQIPALVLGMLGRLADRQKKNNNGVVIKHTSGNLANAYRYINESESGLFLYTSLEDWLAHFCVSKGAQIDVISSIPERLGWFNRKLDTTKLHLNRLQPIEMATVVWLLETARGLRLGDRICPVNFDRWGRQKPESGSEALVEELARIRGHQATDEQALVLEKVVNQNAKSTDPFTYDDRRKKLAASLEKHKGVIKKTLKFAESITVRESNFGFLQSEFGRV